MAANALAVSGFVPLLDRYPRLRTVSPDAWDFFATVAMVFMAATRLNNLKLGEALEEDLMAIVAQRLDEWNPSGTTAFDDCKVFFERQYDLLATTDEYRQNARFLASDSVGKWLVWNIFGKTPASHEDLGLVRESGILVTSSVFQWWE